MSLRCAVAQVRRFAPHHHHRCPLIRSPAKRLRGARIFQSERKNSVWSSKRYRPKASLHGRGSTVKKSAFVLVMLSLGSLIFVIVYRASNEVVEALTI